MVPITTVIVRNIRFTSSPPPLPIHFFHSSSIFRSPFPGGLRGRVVFNNSKLLFFLVLQNLFGYSCRCVYFAEYPPPPPVGGMIFFWGGGDMKHINSTLIIIFSPHFFIQSVKLFLDPFQESNC